MKDKISELEERVVAPELRVSELELARAIDCLTQDSDSEERRMLLPRPAAAGGHAARTRGGRRRAVSTFVPSFALAV